MIIYCYKKILYSAYLEDIAKINYEEYKLLKTPSIYSI